MNYIWKALGLGSNISARESKISGENENVQRSEGQSRVKPSECNICSSSIKELSERLCYYSDVRTKFGLNNDIEGMKAVLQKLGNFGLTRIGNNLEGLSNFQTRNTTDLSNIKTAEETCLALLEYAGKLDKLGQNTEGFFKAKTAENLYLKLLFSVPVDKRIYQNKAYEKNINELLEMLKKHLPKAEEKKWLLECTPKNVDDLVLEHMGIMQRMVEEFNFIKEVSTAKKKKKSKVNLSSSSSSEEKESVTNSMKIEKASPKTIEKKELEESNEITNPYIYALFQDYSKEGPMLAQKEIIQKIEKDENFSCMDFFADTRYSVEFKLEVALYWFDVKKSCYDVPSSLSFALAAYCLSGEESFEIISKSKKLENYVKHLYKAVYKFTIQDYSYAR